MNSRHQSSGRLLRYSIGNGFHLNGDHSQLLGVVHLIIHAKNILTHLAAAADLYIIGAVCVSVSKSHYLLGKLFWQVNFFS